MLLVNVIVNVKKMGQQVKQRCFLKKLAVSMWLFYYVYIYNNVYGQQFISGIQLIFLSGANKKTGL